MKKKNIVSRPDQIKIKTGSGRIVKNDINTVTRPKKDLQDHTKTGGTGLGDYNLDDNLIL